ncbi:hypothetical protein P3X46_001721 [Hevea brasiliensis]|uniref:Protein MIZU-KUSSEI 1 n=1 Tax=Hevea brasiliensis TaxID=3981 RepID=A0ABQ9NE05_HEVBR|nr:protein MIZU-KUSSEI 1 [Hevea brasiliensis]KAJ9190533.1 hypothetical protein P3X46_001721 [Hevea brasiliensis]
MASASPTPPSLQLPPSSPEHTPFSSKSEPLSPRSPPSPPRPAISLQQPTNKKGPSKSAKLFRRFRAVFRSFPIITPTCKIPVSLHGNRLHDGHIHGGTRMTGTLFGHRKARINLAIQENPSSLPILLLELTISTGKLLQDMGMGLVRIALECEKKPNEKTKIVDEPIWTMYCNGRKSGYGVKREPTDEDLIVMQILRVISMGAGVLPDDGTEHPDGELTYMRSHFERVIGSKDSETYYMMNPDGNSGPELTIFFVRI